MLLIGLSPPPSLSLSLSQESSQFYPKQSTSKHLAMALTISSLAASLSSLSFSSRVSDKPTTLSFPRLSSLPFSLSHRPSPLVISASVAELETADLEKYVKSRLPGGFAAQTIIGTGRRKSAIARVVLQEGTGKVIINYRDAKVYLALPSLNCSCNVCCS